MKRVLLFFSIICSFSCSFDQLPSPETTFTFTIGEDYFFYDWYNTSEKRYLVLYDNNNNLLWYDSVQNGQTIQYENEDLTPLNATIIRTNDEYLSMTIDTYRDLDNQHWGLVRKQYFEEYLKAPTSQGLNFTITVKNVPSNFRGYRNYGSLDFDENNGGDWKLTVSNYSRLSNLIFFKDENETELTRYFYQEEITNGANIEVNFKDLPFSTQHELEFEGSISEPLTIYGITEKDKIDLGKFGIAHLNLGNDIPNKFVFDIPQEVAFDSFYIQGNIYTLRGGYYSSKTTSLPVFLSFPEVSYDIKSTSINETFINTSGSYQYYKIRHGWTSDTGQFRVRWYIYGRNKEELNINPHYNLPLEIIQRHDKYNFVNRINLKEISFYTYENRSIEEAYSYLLSPTDNRASEEFSSKLTIQSR